ncbi:MAG: insulinase family protein [Lentimicrobium sp.]|nr:insulinase family protein [Lentimicrobium sp.]HPG32284.1 pitrilysin family protein [Lentimicrobium sp.]
MGMLSGSMMFGISDTEAQTRGAGDFSVDFTKYKLDNGLEVVLHPDHSDPVVSVAILYHVGSSREKQGKTGFAHFFEHMLFQNSENVGKGVFFKKIDDLGGTFNGGTWNDGTVYYEVVPKDALEKIMWMESDRMGFLINTVTELALAREKDIVINEKRQRVDNQPYGHTGYVIDQNLYGQGHPYSWQVIGSMDDLRSATLDDVREFYDKYYCVNNATMVIAGDFDEREVKSLVQKYFGEFKARTKPETMNPMPARLTVTKKFYHEDNFARLPELNMVFPSVETYHPDSYALEVLADLLADGKKAPLYKEIVENRKLAPKVMVYNNPMELAGKFNIVVRAFEGVDLDQVNEAINEGFRQFEKNGFTDQDMQRIKNLRETSFYNSIASLLGKSFQLVQSNVFGGDPARMMDDVRLLNAVTREDVIRVYNTYIKGHNFLATSFVPKGKPELALDGSEKAAVVEESIENSGSQAEGMEEVEEKFERTKTTFDRTIEPPLGPKPLLNTPAVFTSALSNGMKVYGIESHELPLVQFSIRFNGGQLCENPAKPGVARLLSDLMMEGTAAKTPEELEEAIGQLGASVDVSAGAENMTITANCLARNYNAVLQLVEEILMQPRWDEKEFSRLKQAAISGIAQRNANPNAIAGNVFYKMLYGENHIFSKPITGTIASVESITLQDLKDYYNAYFSPSVASFHIAGDVTRESALKSIANLEQKWAKREISLPEYQLPATPEKAQIYFVDVPNAKQSVIMIGSLAMSRNNPDYFPATFVNYKLGDGSGSKLFEVLRLEKGYTYGAYSFFMPRTIPGPFVASSSVQSMYTLESVQLFNQILGSFGNDYSAEDLEITRNATIRSNAGKFETINSLMGMLQEISSFGLPVDYVKQEELKAEKINIEEAKSVYSKYVNPEKMVYVIVGDARTQFDRLKEAGLGEPVLVDMEGNRIVK